MISRLKSYWKRSHPASYRWMRRLWNRFWKMDYALYELKSRLSGYRAERQRVAEALGYYPALDRPRTINEKVLHKKINQRNPLLTETADKIKVRAYVRDKLGPDADDLLIPVRDAARDPSNLAFCDYEIPYVIKANHGWNMNLFVERRISDNRFIVSMEDLPRSEWTKTDIIEECRRWLNITHGFEDHQWAYLNIERKVFVEPVISQACGYGLTDVKIDCFHGEPKFVLVMVSRPGGRLKTLVDAEGRTLDVRCNAAGEVSDDILDHVRCSLPDLRRWSGRLSEEFGYCRVDFYLTANDTYFSEITHYPASGRRKIKPQAFGLEMGRHWHI